MSVPLWVWLVTIGGFVAIILADLFLVDHKPHAVTAREATRWVLFYVALAVAFGIGLWVFAGQHSEMRANTSTALGGVTTATLLLDPQRGLDARKWASVLVHEQA